ASRGLDDARQAGLQSWETATVLTANAADAVLALGRTAEGAPGMAQPATTPPGREHWLVQVVRAEVALLHGDADAAASRRLIPAIINRADFGFDGMQRAVEAALWAGQPEDAIRETRRALALFKAPDLTIFCGRLLAAGMRACADLAEQARARRDPPAVGAGAAAAHHAPPAVVAAAAAADSLVTWVERMGGAPFTGHPFVATIPAERATWDAE